MSKIILYPYSEKWQWILQQSGKEFETVNAIIPIGWNSDGELIEGVFGEEDFKSRLIESECLWIVDSRLNLDFQEYIVDKIKMAVSLGKKIFCTRRLTEKEHKELEKIVPLEQWITGEREDRIVKKVDRIYDIDIPIVYIVGASKEVNSIEQLIKLKQSFGEEYKVALVSDAKEVAMFNKSYWLSMFWSNKILEQSERMVQANHCIKNIEMEENPDIILVGITSGISYFGNKIVEDFGIHAYSLSRVVKPDCVIANIFCGNYDSQMLLELGNEIKNIVGIAPDFYNMVDKCIEPEKSEEERKIYVVKVGEEIVRKYIEQLKCEIIYHVRYESEYIRLSEAILNKLEEYADVYSL